MDWLALQDLKPKELVALLNLSLEIGYEAVMRREYPSVPPADLSAYDASYLGTGKDVSAVQEEQVRVYTKQQKLPVLATTSSFCGRLIPAWTLAHCF